MATSYELVKTVTAQLYDRSLRGIPEDTRAALQRADAAESNETARHTLRIMLRSADVARASSQFICSDAGVPVFFVRVGTQAQFSGNVRQAIADAFDELVATIQPPASTTPRVPKRSLSAPQPKPAMPMARKLSVIALDMPARDQPVSRVIGSRNTARENMAPIATQVIRAPSATITQA